jgi:transcriptional regulator with XRE-family HTH domain
MSTENVDKIDPAQCRGARGLLNMTQPKLARAAGLGLSTIVDFERKRRDVSPEAIAAIRHALEAAGIEFIDEDGGGAGARLRKPSQHKSRK